MTIDIFRFYDSRSYNDVISAIDEFRYKTKKTKILIIGYNASTLVSPHKMEIYRVRINFFDVQSSMIAQFIGYTYDSEIEIIQFKYNWGEFSLWCSEAQKRRRLLTFLEALQLFRNYNPEVIRVTKPGRFTL